MEMADVTGFDIFVLCHNFGRRARAMAHSLSAQVAAPSLRLTVFYSRAEDQDYIRQGALAGPSPVFLQFVQVEQDVVMQRAIHYSRIAASPDHSHTVFMDADLWFPPTFWRQYADSLARELPGYWSCKVLNIPYDLSEERARKPSR